MKRSTSIMIADALAAALLAPNDALSRPKEDKTKGIRPGVEVPAELVKEGEALLESLGRPVLKSAAVDTFCIVWYDFETVDWQGWTAVDNTAQVDTFFHIDDFAGLGGGDYGRLVPIEGTKSAWCGTRSGDDFYLCHWRTAPGYGNLWDQSLVTDAFPFTGILTFSYHGVFDSEFEWDYTHVEYCFGEDWIRIVSIDDVLDTVAVHTLFTGAAQTKLRFHFVSDGSWSDQDGLFDSDGACIIDSITVSDDTGLIHFEDFESADAGALDTDFWHCRPGEAYGSYAGIIPNLQDKDPCGTNFTSQIVFFIGSPWMSADYPGMPVTPFCTGAGGLEGPCQSEAAVSPVIDMTRYSSGCDEVQDLDIPPEKLPELGGAILRYTIYMDLPRSNLVFYNWKMRSIVDGCPNQWEGHSIAYSGGDREYIQIDSDVSWWAGEYPVQIAFNVIDMCEAWYGVYGDCAEHTPSPWLDNIRLYSYSTIGPQWNVRNLDLFQDTFPQDGNDIESFCRADNANDIAPGDEFGRIDPGDSAVVTVDAPLAGGLDTLGTGEARVYFHCSAQYIGCEPLTPHLFGPSLEGTYGSYVSDDGDWTILLCEPAATSAGNIAPDKYCIDLNDSLFTRGYMIEYYFKAYDFDGIATTWPHSAEAPDGDRYEFTCLPTLKQVPCILYVDDYHNRGTFEGIVQTYMDQAITSVNPGWELYPHVDRYDVNGPSYGVSNGIGAYVSAGSASAIFCQAYDMVLFDSGDLNSVTISDGTGNSDKSNDAQLLVDWLRLSDHDVGLCVLGDDVAYDLDHAFSAVSAELMSTICGVQLVDRSFFELTGGVEGGGIANPLVLGVPGSPFEGFQYYAYGGCPGISDFDVLDATGPGEYGLRYDGYLGGPPWAGIYTEQLNNGGHRLATIWIGHSIMMVRDADLELPPARKRLMVIVYGFLGAFLNPPSPAEIPAVTSLSDNFPNPFNPATRLKFNLAKKGHVRLRVYDVSGRLVRVLIDEIREAGSYEAIWNGTNDEGRKTASGIYFCRMEAGDYERTLKMVQLR